MGRLDPVAALPDALTADAMDDAAAARELIDDLLALVEAGCVAPIDLNGETRYAAIADPGQPTMRYREERRDSTR